MYKYPEDYLESAATYLKRHSINFSESRILVTGASGFIGSWIVEVLRYYTKAESQKIQVLGLSRNLNKTFEKLGKDNYEFLNWVEGGIEKIPVINFRFSHAIHCATPTTKKTGSEDLENVKSSSILGMQYLLDAAKISGNKPRILHTSSGAVYGNSELIDGRFPLLQEVHQSAIEKSSRHYAYALAKKGTEIILNQATEDGYVSGVNARLFAFFGPGLPTTSQYAIGNLINQAVSSDFLCLNGTGMATRSYLPGNAMAAMVLYILGSELIGATHVGSPDGLKLREWAQIVSDVSNKPLKILSKFDDSSDKYVPDWDRRIPKINFQRDRQKVIDCWLGYVKTNLKLDS